MKFKSLNQIFILGICLIISQNVFAYSAPDLYSPTDDVIRLNSTTFIPFVYNENKNLTYMVQFYNSYCGHCQMFAPIYKELGSRIKNWTSVFRLAAIDCSKDENIITCSENKIEGYPTIYIFPPNAKIKDEPLNLRSLNIKWTVDDIEESIVDYMTNLTTIRTKQQDLPLVVEALQPITQTELNDLKRIYTHDKTKHDHNVDYHNNQQDLMFIVESEQSYLGRKLIIEYFRINSKLELRRILLTNKKLLTKLLSGEEFAKLDDNQPLLIKINGLHSEKNYAFKKAQVLVKGEENHILPTSADHERLDFIFNRFRMFFEHYYSVELENDSNTITKPNLDNKATNDNNISDLINNSNHGEIEIQYLLNNEPSLRKRIFAIDLLKSISFMITHEIKIKGDLSPIEFNTVRNILTILKKYLPLEKWDKSVHKFIVELRTRLDDNRSNYEMNGIKAQEMRDLLDLSGADGIRLRYNRENWISCFQSERSQKGYTCSLWLLFHTLTVGEYSKAAPVRTRPTMVLFTMRDYITKFLGCTVCSSNFEKETDSLDSSISSRNSSIIWLWNTHNRVNQRLNNEKGMELKKPLKDVIYPNKTICPQCLRSELSDIGLDGKTLDDIDWDMESILNFLLNTYRPDSIVSPLEMATLLSKLKNKLNYDILSDSNRLDNSNYDNLRRIIPNSGGLDMNKSVEQWNLFSTSDISLCLFLYLASIIIVAIVCVSLKPRWKRFKTK